MSLFNISSSSRCGRTAYVPTSDDDESRHRLNLASTRYTWSFHLSVPVGVKLPSPGFHLNFSYDDVAALSWALWCIFCEMLFKSFTLVFVGCLLPWVCRSPFCILNGSSFGKHRVRQIFSPSLWLISLFSYWFLGEFPPPRSFLQVSTWIPFLHACQLW